MLDCYTRISFNTARMGAIDIIFNSNALRKDKDKRSSAQYVR